MNIELIDLHHHILPQQYLNALSKVGITKAGGVNFPRWDLESSLNFMNKHDIAKSIVSISSPGIFFGDPKFTQKLARDSNEFCASLIKKHPDRFGSFAVLPLPDVDASIAELKYSLDEIHLDGITLLSNINGMYLGDPQFEDLYQELDERKAVVFIHPNTPPEPNLPKINLRGAMLEFVFDTTRAAANLVYNNILDKYPNIKFILSHAGGTIPFLTWRLSFGMKKIIDSLKNFYYDIALSATEYALPSLQALVDPTHIVFGTDFPFLPIKMIDQMIEGFENYHNFNDEIRKAIGKNNALQLFK